MSFQISVRIYYKFEFEFQSKSNSNVFYSKNQYVRLQTLRTLKFPLIFWLAPNFFNFFLQHQTVRKSIPIPIPASWYSFQFSTIPIIVRTIKNLASHK